MADFDDTEKKSLSEQIEQSKTLESTKCLMDKMLKKLVFCVSFGPGVLGVVWLIGRILRR